MHVEEEKHGDTSKVRVARRTQQRSNRIAEKLVARMRREVHGKIVNLKNFITARAAAEELQKTIVSKEALAGFLPAHAAYVYA